MPPPTAPGASALAGRLESLRRESRAAPVVQPGAPASSIDALRARVLDIRRESTMPKPAAAPPAATIPPPVAEPDGFEELPMDLSRLKGLRALSEQLFGDDQHVSECQEALTHVLKRSNEGATKDSRIEELADLVKRLRKCLRRVRRPCIRFALAGPPTAAVALLVGPSWTGQRSMSARPTVTSATPRWSPRAFACSSCPQRRRHRPRPLHLLPPPPPP